MSIGNVGLQYGSILESKMDAILGFISTYIGFLGGKEPKSSV